jgi:DNA-binding response OmpR family regulator
MREPTDEMRLRVQDFLLALIGEARHIPGIDLRECASLGGLTLDVRVRDSGARAGSPAGWAFDGSFAAYGGKSFRCTGNARALLETLVAAGGEPVPSESIWRTIWGDDPFDRCLLNTLVWRLRVIIRKAFPDAEDPVEALGGAYRITLVCAAPAPPGWSFGDNSATYQGRSFAVRGLRLKLLRALAAAPGQPVPNRDLRVAVWGADHQADDNQLRNLVSQLRTLLAESLDAELPAVVSEGGGHRLLPV